MMKIPAKKLPINPRNEADRKTFLEHIQELRQRFFVSFSIFLLASIAGYFLYPHILSWLLSPLGKPLYYTSPTGGFEAVFGVSIFFGFIITIPVFIYQTFKFVEPTIFRFDLKNLAYILGSSTLLVIFGIATAYYLILPPSLRFLNDFGGDKLSALISTKDYFSFIMKYLLSFALIFQLPIILLIWDDVNPLNINKLITNFKWVFLFSFIVSAILTPTADLLNQMIMAAPILILYLLSVLLLWIINPKKLLL